MVLTTLLCIWIGIVVVDAASLFARHCLGGNDYRVYRPDFLDHHTVIGRISPGMVAWKVAMHLMRAAILFYAVLALYRCGW